MDLNVVVDAISDIFTDIADYLPNVVYGLIVLLVGYLVAWVLRWFLRLVLGRVGIDEIAERTGIIGGLRGIGIAMPASHLLAQTIFSLLLLSFMITAAQLMRLDTLAVLLERLLNFLPSVIAALVVFLLGSTVARFAGNWTSLVATAGGLSYARQLGNLVQYLVVLFVAVLALSVLGIEIGLLVTAITIMLGAFGLAIGIALGLGGRRVVFHILAGYYVRQRYRPGQVITLDQVSGEVSGTGSVSTVVTTDDGQAFIPNGLLLESLVRAAGGSRQETSPPPQS